MSFFNKKPNIYYSEREIKQLEEERTKLQKERETVEKYVDLQNEIEQEKQRINELKLGSSKQSSSNNSGKAGEVVKGFFSGVTSVLGEMAKSSQEHEKETKKMLKKSKGVKL